MTNVQGGIGHDLNTLLTAILGYANLTARDAELPERLRATSSDTGAGMDARRA